MEFFADLPPRFKIRGLNEKYLLKRAFRADLPEEVVQRPKQPHQSPIYRSLVQNSPPEYVEEPLSEEALRKKATSIRAE